MTLLRFQPSNHPQQVRAGNGSSEKDERYTRLVDFMPWHTELRHTLDVAGCPEAPVSRLIGRWCGRAGISADGLAFDWDDEIVWCNGPYSDVRPWLWKAWTSHAVVDSLWPANRTEQPFWKDLVEPFRDRPGSPLRCQFVPGRLRFGTPEDPDGLDSSSPPFGCVRLTWVTAERPAAWMPRPPAQLSLLGVP